MLENVEVATEQDICKVAGLAVVIVSRGVVYE
jgi:hypothetical protein